MSRELDVEVAIQVLGWKRYKNAPTWWAVTLTSPMFRQYDSTSDTPPFTTDATAAMEVVRRLNARDLCLDIRVYPGGQVRAEVFTPDGQNVGESDDCDSVAEAICRAALSSLPPAPAAKAEP